MENTKIKKKSIWKEPYWRDIWEKSWTVFLYRNSTIPTATALDITFAGCNKMWDIRPRRLVVIDVWKDRSASFFRDKLSENKMGLWFRVNPSNLQRNILYSLV
jgi:hypothetical protein